MSQVTDAVGKMETEVTAITSVVDSAVVLLGSLAAQIRENANAPAKLIELAATLDNKKNDLAAAIDANTV